MLRKIFNSLDSFKYSPIHPQWMSNSWHLKKIDLIKKHFDHGVCLDIGCGNNSIDNYLANNALSIIKLDYPTTSKRYSNSPDVYADVQQLPINANIADAVIFFEVIEHVPNDEAAIQEIARILKGSGLLFISAPFLYPLHDQPFDFKRYTCHGLNHLLIKYGFEIIEVKQHGNSITTIMQLINLSLLDLIKSVENKSRLLALLLVVPAGITCLLSNLISLAAYNLQSPNLLLLGHTVVAKKVVTNPTEG